MLKILIIVCALFGILTAVALESWLRRHHGNKDVASSVYIVTLEKYSEFWIAILFPSLVILGIGGIFVGFGIGINPLIAYTAGAAVTFLSVCLGSRSYSSSVVSSASLIADGDLKAGMRAAFRGGSVIGLILASLGVSALSVLFFYFKQKQLVNVAASFALGASLAGISIRLFGSILTAAHKLSESKKNKADYVGAFASNGAEYILLLLVSACTTALLAEVGVEASGVTSTFTVVTASKFPIIILACGIVASVIGIFAYCPHTGKYAHIGITVGSFIAGILSFGAAFYFSVNRLESPVYAFCIGLGILAQLLSGEFCKLFSMDSQIFKTSLPRTNDEDIDIPMINGLSAGFISAIVPGVFTMVALIISFKIANYYGIALAAIGANSITGTNLAVRNFATSLSASTSFAKLHDESEESNKAYYNVLTRTSAKAKASGRAYSAVSEALTLTALLTAFTFTAEHNDVVLSDPLVFGGMIYGTVFVMVLLGLLIRSVIMSTSVMLESSADDPEEYRSIVSVKGIAIIEIIAIVMPIIIGIVLGTYCVSGFIGAAIVTGFVLIMAFNNTGRYYDRISTDTLGSIILIMTTIALAAVPAFMHFGSVFF